MITLKVTIDYNTPVETVAVAVALKAAYEEYMARLRDNACQVAESAYLFARDVDKKPCDQTREAACKEPSAAYRYALFVDCRPHVDTFLGVLTSPEFAFEYAKNVDLGASDPTREAASKNPYFAMQYAEEVDRCYHPVTAAGVKCSPANEKRYELLKATKWSDSYHDNDQGNKTFTNKSEEAR